MEALIALQISLVAANAIMQAILDAQGGEVPPAVLNDIEKARKDSIKSLDESIAAREAAPE